MKNKETSGYFFQGFLFVFGLGATPFMNEVNAENKISHYWENVGQCIHSVFHGQSAKSTQKVQ